MKIYPKSAVIEALVFTGTQENIAKIKQLFKYTSVVKEVDLISGEESYRLNFMFGMPSKKAYAGDILLPAGEGVRLISEEELRANYSIIE